MQADTWLSITNPLLDDTPATAEVSNFSPSNPHNGESDDITQPLHELASQTDTIPTSDTDPTANSTRIDTKFPPIPPTVSSPSIMGEHSHRILLDNLRWSLTTLEFGRFGL